MRHDPSNPLGASELHLASLYLDAPVALGTHPGAHRIALDVQRNEQGNWKGKLQIDSNHCSLNAFGDPEACTKVAVHSIDVIITPLRMADPSKLGRAICSVEGDELPQRTALVLSNDGEETYLKVESQLVPLFPRHKVSLRS